MLPEIRACCKGTIYKSMFSCRNELFCSDLETRIRHATALPWPTSEQLSMAAQNHPPPATISHLWLQRTKALPSKEVLDILISDFSLPCNRNSDQIQQNDVKPQPLWLETKSFSHRSTDSPSSVQNYASVSEQLSGLNERLDTLLSRLGELESKFASITHNTASQRQSIIAPNFNGGLQVGSYGGNGGSSHVNGNGSVNGPTLPFVGSAGSLYQESSLAEEVTLLSRGQRHIHSQLDMLNKYVRESLSLPLQPKRHEKGFLESLVYNMKTSESGFATATIVTTLFFGSVAAVIAARFLRRKI